MPDTQSKSDKNDLDAMANVRVENDYDDNEDSDNTSDLERGHRRSASSSQAGNRVYSVTERPKTLFRRVLASASAIAAWALNYDQKAAQQL